MEVVQPKSPSSRSGRVLHKAFSSPIIERLSVITTEMGQKIRTYMALLHKIVDTSGICQVSWKVYLKYMYKQQSARRKWILLSGHYKSVKDSNSNTRSFFLSLRITDWKADCSDGFRGGARPVQAPILFLRQTEAHMNNKSYFWGHAPFSYLSRIWLREILT